MGNYIPEAVIDRINQIDSNIAGTLHNVVDFQNEGKPEGVQSLYVVHTTLA